MRNIIDIDGKSSIKVRYEDGGSVIIRKQVLAQALHDAEEVARLKQSLVDAAVALFDAELKVKRLKEGVASDRVNYYMEMFKQGALAAGEIEHVL